jgi:hypothetical protein
MTGLTTRREFLASQYEHLLSEHLALKDAYYAMETRWPDSPFWARRSVQPAASSGAAEGQ